MKCWHISPNGKPGKCKGEDRCSYRKQGIKLKHYDSLAEALLDTERDTAVKRLVDEGIPARAEVTQEQASLIPARDKALYIADFKNRTEAAAVTGEYAGSLFTPEIRAAFNIQAEEPVVPISEWRSVDASFTNIAKVSKPAHGSVSPANKAKALELMKANRSYRAGAQTAAEVIAADEAHPSYETLRKNRDAYIKRIASMGEETYAAYALCAYEHYLVARNRSLAKHTGLILERLVTSSELTGEDYERNKLSDDEKRDVFHATAYTLSEHPQYAVWAQQAEGALEIDGLKVPSSPLQMRELIDMCSNESDPDGYDLIMTPYLPNVGKGGFDFSEIVTPTQARTPELTPTEVLLSRKPHDKAAVKEDLKALKWNDAVARSYGTIKEQMRRCKFAETDYAHYENPAYHNLGGREHLRSVSAGDIIRRRTRDGSSEYAVVLDASRDGVLYQTVSKYTSDNSPVLVDADRALALYRAGAERCETPAGFTAYPDGGAGDITYEGWRAW